MWEEYREHRKEKKKKGKTQDRNIRKWGEKSPAELTLRKGTVASKSEWPGGELRHWYPQRRRTIAASVGKAGCKWIPTRGI